MNRECNEEFMRARFDLSQDDQTCMFSEHAKTGEIPYKLSELHAAWERYYEKGDLTVMDGTKWESMASRLADQTCMFSEHAHHVELANRDEQEGEECGGICGLVMGLVAGAGFALALLIIVVSNLPGWLK